VLPASAAFVSATPSQGSCSNDAAMIICHLGSLGTGTNATVSVVANFAAGETVTNFVAVSRNGIDPYLSNNTAVAVTVIKPRLGGDFQITSLGAGGCQVVDHNSLTGDDRGGIAVSDLEVFYTGDSSTARFVRGDLSGGAALGIRYEALTGDLHSEKIYSLGVGAVPLGANGGTVTTLLELDGATGALTGNSVALSSAISVTGETGIFAGYDQVALYTAGRVYSIALPSGTVRDLGTMTAPTHSQCENWAYWGVAEFFGGDLYLAYVRDSEHIERARVPDGAVSTVQTFEDLSDMCSFSVSISLGRWYFHHEGGSQFGGSSETLGYCTATFAATAMSPTGSSALPVIAPRLAATRSGNSVSISFNTSPGISYILETADSLTSGKWQRMQTVVGDGSLTTVRDTTPAVPQRFYRIRIQ
jgi:hypothetical protein